MSLKLLSKKEVDAGKAQQDRLLAQEGLKLARKVDSLRETAVQEEASLEQFRSNTIAAIHEEISTEMKKKDDLKEEIESFRVEKSNFELAVTRTWDEIGIARNELSELKTSLEERETAVKEREGNVHAQDEISKAELGRVENMKEVIAEAQAQAVADIQKAEDATKQAELIHEGAVLFRERIEEDLTKRESELAQREKEVSLGRSSIEERERALEAGWKLLNDRKATFERTLKRNQHN